MIFEFHENRRRENRYEYNAAQNYELLKICTGKAIILLWTQPILPLHVCDSTIWHSQIVQR